MNFLSLILIFLVTFLSSSLTAQSKLVFSTVNTNTPIVDICYKRLSKVYKKLGIEITYTSLPPARSLYSSNTGVTDGELFRIKSINKTYSNLKIVPTPVYIMSGTGLIKKEKFHKDKNLKNKIFWLEHSIVWQLNYIKKHNYPNMKGMDYRKAVQLLKLNRIDIILGGKSTLEGIIARHRLVGYEVIEPPLVEEKLYHFVHKKHEKLIPKITTLLKQIP